MTADTTREALLDAACALLVVEEWSRIRVVDIAARVGVSRQTLYNGFGTKENLGRALVRREAGRLLTDIFWVTERHEDPPAATIAEAVRVGLRAASDHPLAKELRRARNSALWPIVTSHAEPLLAAIRDALAVYIVEHWRRLDLAQARDVADVAVRLGVSALVLPIEPADRAADRISRVVERLAARPGTLVV